MQWGKINKGQLYGLMCVDIDRAIAHMHLAPLEQMLLQYIREHSWGVSRYKKRQEDWPDPVPCPLNISQLAIDWGVSRPRLQDAKSHLIDLCMIEEGRGGVMVNKEVETWRGITRKALEYAKRGCNVPDEDDAPVPDQEHDITESPSVTVPDREQKCSLLGTSCVPDREQPNGRDTIEERAELIQTNSDSNTDEEGAPRSAPSKLPATFQHDPSAITKASEIVEALNPLAFWGLKVPGIAKLYPLDWIIDAASEAAAGNKPWVYALRILQRWTREGRDHPRTNGKPRASPGDKPPLPPVSYTPTGNDFSRRRTEPLDIDKMLAEGKV